MVKSKKKVKIGVIPVHRGFLSMNEAVRQKGIFVDVISKIRPDSVSLIDLDDVCENGILCNADDVDKVLAKMKDNEADAIFLAFCNFGEESAAVRVVSALKLPVLVWGARDEKPNSDEERGRDTQCGMFAATKALARFGVTYSYIHNVPASSNDFKNGFEQFVRAIAVVKSLKRLKIAQIGQRPAPFMSVIASEAAITEQLGIEIVPINVTSIVRLADEFKNDTKKEEIEQYIKEIKSRVDLSRLADDRVINMAAFKLAIQESVVRAGCSAAALECWSVLPLHMGFTPCFVVSEMTDEGFPISCEADLNGAITSVMLDAASLGDSPSFFADLTIRHPDNDNAELLWHCGPFPHSLCDPDSKPFLAPDGRARFPLKKGNITVARMDDLHGKFTMTAVEGKAVDGPPTTGTYVYFETDNWRRVEEKFIFGPYIHHVSGCYGQYSRCLKEAMRFIENIKWDDPNFGPTSL